MLFMIDNIHNEKGTYYTDSTLPGYYIMSVVCILYGYQDSALNHMKEGIGLLTAQRTSDITSGSKYFTFLKYHPLLMSNTALLGIVTRLTMGA